MNKNDHQKLPKHKIVEGMNSGYITLRAIAKRMGFIDSNDRIVIPESYTVVSDPDGHFWNIIKD